MDDDGLAGEVSCADLVTFADGELGELAPAFRDHLIGCPGCRDGLVEAMVLLASLSEMSARSPRWAWPAWARAAWAALSSAWRRLRRHH